MHIISYYISDYGYGHATRSIAIIRELLKKSSSIKVIVCHSYSLSFIKKSLISEPRVEFRYVNTDVGYKLKENSLEPDRKYMKEELKKYIDKIDYTIEREINFCFEKKVRLIISDIVPFAFTVANKLNIKSIGITNFTWFTAYQGLVGKDILNSLKTHYSLMNNHFRLVPSKEPVWGYSKELNMGFISREGNEEDARKIRRMIDPTGEKIIVYFSFGMMKSDIDVNDLHLWENQECIFVVSHKVNINSDNVYKIPESYTESQNFILASDIVITKPGWSTVAESLIYKKPLIILKRKLHLEEDFNTVKYLILNNRAKVIDWNNVDDLKIDKEYLECFKHNYNCNYNYVNYNSLTATEVLKLLN